MPVSGALTQEQDVGSHGRHEDTPAGWPAGQHGPVTPRGEAEQLDKFLAGLSRQKGWRRVAAAAVLLVMLAAIVAGLTRLIR